MTAVLITGASGFIGAHLARTLIADGATVHLIVRPNSNLWRLQDLTDRFTLHHADLTDRDAVKRVLHSTRPKSVYNLAVYGVYGAQRDRQKIWATNVMGLCNLLDALDDVSIDSLVHTGSSWEYGSQDVAVREEDLPNPQSDYALSKATATRLCQLEAQRGKPITIVRIFSAYGPLEAPTRLVPYLMSCCSHGVSPELGPGDSLRDFVYVEDIVELLKTIPQHRTAQGCILHAASGHRWTVRDMVTTVIAVSGHTVDPIYGVRPQRAEEPRHSYGDIQRTTHLTGWRPRFSLIEGVEHCWRQFSRTHSN